MCLHTLLPTFNRFRAPRTHSRVPTHVFKPDCSFSTRFQLLSTIFSCLFFFKKYFIRFHLFSIDFIHFSIVFICFRLFLPKFKCYCSFSPISLIYFFSYIFHYTRQKLELFYTLVILSDRVRSGQPWVGPGRANSSDLALDPMQAGPGHEKSGPTLALPMDSVGLPIPVPQLHQENGFSP